MARRPAIRLLVTPQRRAALERIVLHATSLRIPIVEVEGGTLTVLAGFDGHQGVALIVAARRYATLDEILARAIERREPPFVLALDSLEDPQNVGTLLRSAEAAGVHGVIFPTHRQAPLTPAAVKASAGAVEHLLLAPVDDLAGALTDLHVRGLRVAGAEAGAPLTVRQADLRGPLVLVVGSEGQGLGPTVRRRCDLVVRIPMRGAIGSLNASVAGSILLFEALAQRDPDGRERPPGDGDPANQGSEPGPPQGDRLASGDLPPSEPGPAPVAGTPPVSGDAIPTDSKPRAKPRASRTKTVPPIASGPAGDQGAEPAADSAADQEAVRVAADTSAGGTPKGARAGRKKTAPRTAPPSLDGELLPGGPVLDEPPIA